jgi:hypothetical protein
VPGSSHVTFCDRASQHHCDTDVDQAATPFSRIKGGAERQGHFAGTTTRGSVSEVARIKQPAIVSVFGESAEPTSLSATMAGPITRLRTTRSRTTARDPHIDLALRQVNRSSEASRPPVRYKP